MATAASPGPLSRCPCRAFDLSLWLCRHIFPASEEITTATARKPTPAEIASLTALADKLATDEKFAHKVASFKPGDEKKLEQALAEAGFKALGVTIEMKA